MTNYQCTLLFENEKGNINRITSFNERINYYIKIINSYSATLNKADASIAARTSIDAAMNYAVSVVDSDYIKSMLHSYCEGKMVLIPGNKNNDLIEEIINYCKEK